MVEIVKDGARLKVPNGAFEDYKASGWSEAEVSTKKTKHGSENPKRDEWDEIMEEEEKDVDKMSMEELQAYCKELGINTSKFQKVGEYKKAIKKKLAESK